MSETGVVKFTFEHVALELPSFVGMEELNSCRRRLLQLDWIGVDEHGIGFGNLSVRDGDTDCFYITSSGTGGLRELTPANYARVTGHDPERNWLRCEGVSIASSEALTHAAIYDAAPAVRAVIHGHSAEQWKYLLDLAPTTSAAAEYGSPAMAKEVSRLFLETDVMKQGIFAMGGHRDGLVAFGATPWEALSALRGGRLFQPLPG